MPKDQLVSRYLESAPIGQAGDVSKEKIAWAKENFLRFFPGKGKSYLDIGPGRGETLLFWKQLGYEDITSVDIAQDVSDHIRNLGFVCTLTDDTVKFLHEKRDSFDFIMLNDVVEHVSKESLVDFMRAVYGSLRKGGLVVIKVPNAQSPFFSVGFYGDLTHVQPFTESSFQQLFRLSNFQKYSFYSERLPVSRSDPKGLFARYIITPIYFWWVRNIRAATGHMNPSILTQSIIAVAEKK